MPDAPPPDAKRETGFRDVWRRARASTWFLPVAFGVAYGIIARLAFAEVIGGVMFSAFLFGVPVACGYLTVATAPGLLRVGDWIGLSALAAVVMLGVAMLFALEGLICVVVWLPLCATLSIVGGIVAGLVRRRGGHNRPMVLASVILLPYALGAGEQTLNAPVEMRTVTNTIEIAAPAAVVWEHVREVAPITPEELGPRFVHRIGFPRPIEARLVGTGVGSVRHATFEGGVRFVETVTEWDENHSLAFTISADDVPPTTFDTHVAVGGPYFDVLDGRYEIEPLGPDRVRLHLSSTHRLETRFNGYTQLWTDRFMGDIQQAILEVVRSRAEREAPTG